MAPLDRTYRLNAKLDFENNASAGIATVSAELSALNEQIESLDSTVNVTFDVDTRGASAKVDALKTKLAEVTGSTARLDVNSRPAHDKIDRVVMRLVAFASRTYSATMDVNIRGESKLVALRAALGAIPNSRTTRVDVNADSGIGVLRRLTGASDTAAGSGRVLSSVFGSRVFGVSVGVLLAGVLAVLPLLGPLAAGFTLVAGAAAVTFGGLGLVGAAVARMVQGLKNGEAAFMPLRRAIDRFKATASDSFRIAGIAAATFSTRIINLATGQLPRLGVASTLTLGAMARGFNQAVNQINRTNTTANSFSRILARIPTIMGHLTRGATLFGAGFINVLRAMLPNINAFARGVSNIAQRFFEWSRTDAARARIQAFLRSATPVALALGRAIMRIGGALIDLGIRHGPTAARGLEFLGRAITAVIRGMSFLLDVARFVVALFRSLPAPVQSFATGALLAASAVTTLYNAIRILRFLLIPLSILVSPAGLIVIGLIAVGAALYAAYQHSETFRAGIQRMVDFVQAYWPTVKEVAWDVAMGVMEALLEMYEVAAPYVDRIWTHIKTAWNAISAATAAAWPVIRDWVIDTADEVVSWFQENWPEILETVDVILSAVMVYIDGFAAFWGGAWEGIKMTLHGVWTAISGLVESAIQIIIGILEVGMGIIQGDWDLMWTGLERIVIAIADGIIAVLTGLMEVALGNMKAMAEGMVSWMQWAYDALVGNSIIPDMVNESIDWLAWWNERGSEEAVSLAETTVAEAQRMLAAWNAAYEAYTNYQSYLSGGNYVDENRMYHMTNGQSIQLRDDSQDSADVKQWNDLPDDWREYYYKMNQIPETLKNATFYEDYSVKGDSVYRALVDPYERAYDTILGNSIVPDMVKGVGRWLGTMADEGDTQTRRWARNVARNIEEGTDPLAGGMPAIRGLDNPLAGVRDDLSDSLGDVSKVGETAFEKLRMVVDDQTKMMRRSTTKEVEDLYSDLDRTFKNTYISGADNFTVLRESTTQQASMMNTNLDRTFRDMYYSGDREFTMLQESGTKQVSVLNTEATRQMDNASRNIIYSLTEAQQTGNAQLATLRNYGAATMEAADTEFRYPIGEAASGIQGYLNDMLYGMRQVIDNASLNLTPPREFQVRLSGAAEGGHAGETAADWGMLSNFISQGKVQWDDGHGGVSGPGSSYLHWWGEGEDSNATEYYIVHGRQENRPVLEAAAHSLGLGVHEHDESKEERHHPYLPLGFANGGIAGLRGFAHGYTMYEDMWDDRTAQIARQTEAATGAFPNTYSTHPDGYEYRAPYSIDWWAAGGPRGEPIGTALGDEVLSYVLSNFASELSYYIWNYNDSWGGSVAAYEPHDDHVHATFMGAGSEGPGGGGGFSPRINMQNLLDTYMPYEQDFGSSTPEQEATQIGQAVRASIIDALSAGSGASYDPEGSVMDWIKQGVVFGNVYDPNDQGVMNSLYSRAMQESTGNPNATNDWDINALNGTPSKGLFQLIGPTWETHRAMYGEDAGSFEPNWSNPVLSTGVATRYMENVYGGPVGANGSGYSEGGIATAMQMALVAEKGPELFIPLHDTRAVQLLFDQIVDWRGANEMSRPTMDVVQRFDAENAVVNARAANTGAQSSAEIRQLGDRLEVALSRQVDAKITNVEEMVDVAVQASLGAQESPAGRQAQARNRAREMQRILDRRG